MRLEQILELKNRDDLDQWNAEQKRVILHLLDLNLLTKNPDEIIEFGKWFSDYLNLHGETPDFEAAERHYKNKKSPKYAKSS
jgi:hypothetical protein